MKIWLVTIGEPVPLRDGDPNRLHRTGLLAHFLAKRGWDVVWWTSTFDHFRRQHAFARDTSRFAGPQLEIRLLRGCGYARNISLARLRDHRQIAHKFGEQANHRTKPDLIVAALPTIDLCDECVRFGRRHQTPVVLDMRDMWPDVFVEVAPEPLKPLAKWLLSPLFRQARRGCAGATAIIGITEDFVDWGSKPASGGVPNWTGRSL